MNNTRRGNRTKNIERIKRQMADIQAHNDSGLLPPSLRSSVSFWDSFIDLSCPL
ncbi:hypothetical protein SERLA73DRAFT_145740 [Serpula lacrymans var. lacrymans S7.3]|uniref:Uncharacterized protein n=1 Tax=Serpula lacrymans var. lacrymans (strain S7.3) TaxID=936435 RepID=F8QEI7_SERL3|nr:hypothetical protein SERLA73DRAFT_145740 [Serpula lacrymans var. lacrymans S7.3]